MLAGVVFIGVGIGILRLAALGIDPYTGFNTASSELVGIPFGNWQLVVNLALFLVVLVFRRDLIGLGTLFNATITGYIVQLVVWLCRGFAPGLPLRIVLLALGCLVVCFSVALYMAADMGLSPYDALAPILIGKRNISFRLMRVITDSVCVALSVAMALGRGGDVLALVGPGTLIMALCTGPLIQFFRSKIIEPVLKL